MPRDKQSALSVAYDASLEVQMTAPWPRIANSKTLIIASEFDSVRVISQSARYDTRVARKVYSSCYLSVQLSLKL